jgi:xanthine dehydrogenase accessory factor
MKREILDRLLADRREHVPVALATNLTSGQQLLIRDGATQGDLRLDIDMVGAALEALREDRSITLATPAGSVFVQSFNPRPRMLIVGAVHIAQPLARMADLAGYGVTVIDPRRSFAAAERFEGFTLTTEWPDDALARLKPDPRCAVITLTHDPKLDDPALEIALRSRAFYIGALGSRKTHASRLQRLRERGFDDGEIGRIHGPVGLDIGAVSPAEIAVSILAQVTAVRRAEAP